MAFFALDFPDHYLKTNGRRETKASPPHPCHHITHPTDKEELLPLAHLSKIKHTESGFGEK